MNLHVLHPVVVAFFIMSLLAGGCSDDAGGQVCAPGITTECACPGGGKGAQTCSAAGDRWEKCVCSPGGDAGLDRSLPDAFHVADTGRDHGHPDVDVDGFFPDASIADLTSTDGPSDVGLPDKKTCTSNAECDDKISCTTDICTVGGCTNILDSNYCLIASTCIATGTVNSKNPCEKCDPLTNKNQWTNNASATCDDKNQCTHSDKCISGTCQGTSYTCDDGLACTSDSCNGSAAPPTGCTFTLKTGFCLIDKKCYSAGSLNSQTSCLACEPSKNPTDWIGQQKSGCVSTIGGGGTAGYKDGAAYTSLFISPMGIAVDSKGVVYVADTWNQKIRTIKNGQVATLCGSTQGYADGPIASAKFNYPHGLDIDAKDNLYVADWYNHKVRVIAHGLVSTLAGTTKGDLDGSLATARFDQPMDVAVSQSGEVFVADWGNNKIKVIANGKVTTIAGSSSGFADGPASTAKFDKPFGVAVDSVGKVYVADLNNSRIRVISGGMVSTFAGSQKGFADGPAASAKFNDPFDVEVDSSGKVYVADSWGFRVRTIANGSVSTLAGSGAIGNQDGPLLTATFRNILGIALDASGNVYACDNNSNNNRIRLIMP